MSASVSKTVPVPASDTKAPNTHELGSMSKNLSENSIMIILEYLRYYISDMPEDLIMIILAYLNYILGVCSFEGGFILHSYPNTFSTFGYHNDPKAENGRLSGCWGDTCECESSVFAAINHPLGLPKGIIGAKLVEFSIKGVLPEDVVSVHRLKVKVDNKELVGLLINNKTFRIYEIGDSSFVEYEKVAYVLQTDGAFAIIYVGGELSVYGNYYYGGNKDHRSIHNTEIVCNAISNPYAFLVVVENTDNKKKRVIPWAYNVPDDPYGPDAGGYYEEIFYRSRMGRFGHMGIQMGGIAPHISDDYFVNIEIEKTSYAFAALVENEEKYDLYTWGHCEHGGGARGNGRFPHDTRGKTIFKLFSNPKAFLVLYVDGTIEIIGTCDIPNDFKNQDVKTCHPHRDGFIIQINDNTYTPIGLYIEKFSEILEGITAEIITIISSRNKYAIHFANGTVVFV